jgi:non-ribosomal peptide synthase protein (TIGR01720 family)
VGELIGALQLVPVGVAGELYIGGAGVARGYLHRPALTADKFVPDPFSQEPGARLYKTGDLVRYLADGNLEFLGRLDHQVKIRGFRIELGEIEVVLGQHPAVQEVVVVARTDTPETARLVAYVVPVPGEPPSSLQVRQFLQTRLPDYMLPAVIVFMAALPLTPSGKLDRRALPVPEPIRPELESTFVEPHTPEQKTLATIWSEILGLDRVGIHDNFFNLGGESLLGIRMIIRAKQEGLQFTPRQLFQHPTIAQLAKVANTVIETRADQSAVTGPLALMPNQGVGFEAYHPDRHIWNISAFFEVDYLLKPELLEQVINLLLHHHDALRTRSIHDEAGLYQFIAPPGESVPFTTFDLSHVPVEQQKQVLESIAAGLQGSLNLESGPLMRVALFVLGSNQPVRLLVLIHHMMCDYYSWEVVWSDLQTLYAQLERGETPQLPPKTTSLKYYAERLIEHTRSGALDGELAYWLAEPRRRVLPLPVDYPGGIHTGASGRTVSASFNIEDDPALQEVISPPAGIQTLDLLLTAVGLACSEWCGNDVVLLHLERHGRETILDDVDLSRTVGWLSYSIPLLLELEATRDTRKALQSVKAQLSRLPNLGIGHSLLQYCRGDIDIAEQLRALPQPQILFNYRGRVVERAVPQAFAVRPAKESAGTSYSLLLHRRHLMWIDVVWDEGQLLWNWTYSEQVHRRSTIEQLAQRVLEILRTLIAQYQ